MNKRLLIVGGVAGGATCAARSRRLSESSEIIIFERGPFVSFANCGLPYYVGNVIAKEDDLLVASPEMFKIWFNIDVRTEHNVRAIDRLNKEIEVEDLKTGRIYRESYDALVLSPGAAPIQPKMEGVHLPSIFTLKTIPDSRKIIRHIQNRTVKRAVIVGGGFIGLEMAENLNRLGLQVTIVELLPQVMPPIDPEMAAFVHFHLKMHKIKLLLGTGVKGFHQLSDGSISVMLQSGHSIPADIVILSMGIRPETELAKQADLKIGEFGGIVVDDHMRTSDEHIWAVGDAVEVRHRITGAQTLLALAGPANRQGRIAADSIMGNTDAGLAHRFEGVQGTAVCGVLGLTVASTGLSEKALKTAGIRHYEKIYLHPDHHADYYPGAKSMTIKLIFSTPDGRILGAQAVGEDGVDKRIDVISMAIHHGATVFDLEEAELCYAPQYGSAKDPVNQAGMIAANVLRGYAAITHWENLGDSDAVILDVREPIEFSKGHAPGAINIPLGQLRDRLHELPKDKEIQLYCYVGKRSYYGLRILLQHGFNAKNISGGYRLYQYSRHPSIVR